MPFPEPRDPSWWTVILACWQGADLHVCPRCNGDRKHVNRLTVRVTPCFRCDARGWLFVP